MGKLSRFFALFDQSKRREPAAALELSLRGASTPRADDREVQPPIPGDDRADRARVPTATKTEGVSPQEQGRVGTTTNVAGIGDTAPDPAKDIPARGAPPAGRDDWAGRGLTSRDGDDLDDPERSHNRALELRRAGDLAGAESAARRADEGGHAAGANLLGVLLAVRGDRRDAAAAFRRASERGYSDAADNPGPARISNAAMVCGDLEQARDVVTALSHAVGSDPRMRAALGMLLQASRTPVDTDDQVAAAAAAEGPDGDLPHPDPQRSPLAHAAGVAGDPDLSQRFADVFIRPWRWLCAVAEHANAAGEHDVAAMAFVFTSVWTDTVLPRPTDAQLLVAGFDRAPPEALRRLADAGRSAAVALRPDTVVAVDADATAMTADSVLWLAALMQQRL